MKKNLKAIFLDVLQLSLCSDISSMFNLTEWKSKVFD